MTAIALIARKELGALLASARGRLWLLAMAVALSALCLFDDAQTMYDITVLTMALGCLLGLVLGIEAVGGERARGSLLPLLLTPVPSDFILLGKLGGIAIGWFATYALALPYLWAVGSATHNLVQSALVLAGLGTPVVLGFGYFAMALGTWLESRRTALLTGLLLLAILASPLFLDAGLQQWAIGRGFVAIDPFSAAINAFGAVINDSAPASAQAARFGVTLIWACVALWLARASFRRLAR